MNTSKLFKAEQEGRLEDFLNSLTIPQIKLLIQQIGDDLDRYKVHSKNYSEEKMRKFGQPYIDRRRKMLNKLSKSDKLNYITKK